MKNEKYAQMKNTYLMKAILSFQWIFKFNIWSSFLFFLYEWKAQENAYNKKSF